MTGKAPISFMGAGGASSEGAAVTNGAALRAAGDLADPHAETQANVRDFLGWIRLPTEKNEVNQVNLWLRSLRRNQETLVVLGIGGSCLGARAVYDFLAPAKRVVFLDNVDGYSFENQIKNLNLKRCHFLAISKSGETSETLFQLAHVLQALREKKLKVPDHITVITEDKASSLRQIAQDLKLKTLNVPFDVGGRFSVLSTVGLTPLMWAGVNVKQVLAGAQWAKEQKDLVASITNFYLEAFSRNEAISIFWFYVDRLKTFGLWLEQLWAESLGKAKNRQGERAPKATTPITCIGATDQHSLLQQFTEGARDKHFMFIRSRQSETSRKIKKVPHEKLNFVEGRSVGELLGIEASATQAILDNLGISTCRLTIERQDARTIGALLFLFEYVVATMGECLDINAFDQPGVEAVKKVTLGTLGDPRYKDQALNNT